MQDTFNIPVLVYCNYCDALVGSIILGGVKRIATASSVIIAVYGDFIRHDFTGYYPLNIESTRCDFIDYW